MTLMHVVIIIAIISSVLGLGMIFLSHLAHKHGLRIHLEKEGIMCSSMEVSDQEIQAIRLSRIQRNALKQHKETPC